MLQDIRSGAVADLFPDLNSVDIKIRSSAILKTSQPIADAASQRNGVFAYRITDELLKKEGGELFDDYYKTTYGVWTSTSSQNA